METVLVEKIAQVMHITMNRPEKRELRLRMASRASCRVRNGPACTIWRPPDVRTRPLIPSSLSVAAAWRLFAGEENAPT